MKSGLLSNLGRALAACLLSALAAAAQTPPPEPPVKLSLMAVIFEGAGPTFYPLADDDKKGMGAVIRDFRRLPSARFMGGPPVDTVVLFFSREGAAARVSVEAHRGGESARERLKVAEYVVGEGRMYALTQLAAYGVEPIRLGVVRRAEVELTPPRVDNRTKAVEVSEIKVHAEGPSFELVLRNASGKDLRAVEIEEYRGWTPKGPPPLYNWKAMPPVKPGKSFSVTLEFGWNSKATREGHAVEPPDRVSVRSALFTDGSYEGSSLFAARAEALREGRRIQLGLALEMLRESGEAPADFAFVQGLALRVGMLATVADWPAVNAFAERYRVYGGEELERLKSLIESGMQLQRAVMLDDLNLFLGHGAAADPAAAGRWLKMTRERYEKLLADV
ncbi:MAG TPA: hypothetical protein VF586_22270 [Pyrinomonadaceae bacterium]|jgi:hypothetical protein